MQLPSPRGTTLHSASENCSWQFVFNGTSAILFLSHWIPLSTPSFNYKFADSTAVPSWSALFSLESIIFKSHWCYIYILHSGIEATIKNHLKQRPRQNVFNVLFFILLLSSVKALFLVPVQSYNNGLCRVKLLLKHAVNFSF